MYSAPRFPRPLVLSSLLEKMNRIKQEKMNVDDSNWKTSEYSLTGPRRMIGLATALLLHLKKIRSFLAFEFFSFLHCRNYSLGLILV